MEEKKLNKTSIKKEEKKLSYDELLNAANYWAQQTKFYKQKIEELNTELQKTNLFNNFKRADYLFKVLELSHQFNMEFVRTCATEIQEFLTPQVTSPEEDEKDVSSTSAE